MKLQKNYTVNCSVVFKFGTEFHDVTGDILHLFMAKGQRSKVKFTESNYVSAAETP